MNKNWLFVTLGVFLLSVVVFVSAHGFDVSTQDTNQPRIGQNSMGFGMRGTMGSGIMRRNMMMYHDEMEKIIEDGTYDDLVTFREKTGMNMIFW